MREPGREGCSPWAEDSEFADLNKESLSLKKKLKIIANEIPSYKFKNYINFAFYLTYLRICDTDNKAKQKMFIVVGARINKDH